jgi:hypothetical protein
MLFPVLFGALSKWATSRELPVLPSGEAVEWRYNAFELLF